MWKPQAAAVVTAIVVLSGCAALQGQEAGDDPKFCQCVYVGGAKEYAELQRLRSARVAEHDQLVRNTLAGSSDADPALWGPWKPEGLDVK